MTPIIPNPVTVGTTSASFTYTLGTAPADVTVTITDMLGNVVKTPFTGNVTATTAQTVQLDLSGLQPGMYIVRLQAGTAIQSQKLMIR